MAGYVKQFRSVRDTWIWTNPDFFRAWTDILMEAAWKPVCRLIGDKLINIPIGGFVASERYLSDRWKWSTTKVRGFLKKLVLSEMIKREVKQGITVITVCEYGSYTDTKKADKAGGKAESKAIYNEPVKQRESKLKKVKKVEEERSISSSSSHEPSALDLRIIKVLASFGIRTEPYRLGPDVLRQFHDSAQLLDNEGVAVICANAEAWSTQDWIKDVSPRLIASKLSDIYHYNQSNHNGQDKYANGF